MGRLARRSHNYAARDKQRSSMLKDNVMASRSPTHEADHQALTMIDHTTVSSVSFEINGSPIVARIGAQKGITRLHWGHPGSWWKPLKVSGRVGNYKLYFGM